MNRLTRSAPELSCANTGWLAGFTTKQRKLRAWSGVGASAASTGRKRYWKRSATKSEYVVSSVVRTSTTLFQPCSFNQLKPAASGVPPRARMPGDTTENSVIPWVTGAPAGTFPRGGTSGPGLAWGVTVRAHVDGVAAGSGLGRLLTIGVGVGRVAAGLPQPASTAASRLGARRSLARAGGI